MVANFQLSNPKPEHPTGEARRGGMGQGGAGRRGAAVGPGRDRQCAEDNRPGRLFGGTKKRSRYKPNGGTR